MDKDVVGRYREGLSKPGEGDTAEYPPGGLLRRPQKHNWKFACISAPAREN